MKKMKYLRKLNANWDKLDKPERHYEDETGSREICRNFDFPAMLLHESTK